MGTKDGAAVQNLLNAIATSKSVTPAYGCICPPTSEQTCASPICPRRPPPGYVAPIGVGPR